VIFELHGARIESAADMQRLMVAELIEREVSARVVREGSVLELGVVPAELEI
jgi:S1-C subfamily serine protease